MPSHSAGHTDTALQIKMLPLISGSQALSQLCCSPCPCTTPMPPPAGSFLPTNSSHREVPISFCLGSLLLFSQFLYSPLLNLPFLLYSRQATLSPHPDSSPKAQTGLISSAMCSSTQPSSPSKQPNHEAKLLTDPFSPRLCHPWCCHISYSDCPLPAPQSCLSATGVHSPLPRGRDEVATENHMEKHKWKTL